MRLSASRYIRDTGAGRGVIAIEPWFLAGSPKIVIDRDGWTIRSVDGSRGVHVEHTVAITADGPLVLPARGRRVRVRPRDRLTALAARRPPPPGCARRAAPAPPGFVAIA